MFNIEQGEEEFVLKVTCSGEVIKRRAPDS